MLGVKYSFKILLISLFKILKCSFGVRDINTYFAKKKKKKFLHKDYLYSFFFSKNIFICLLCNLNEEKFDLFIHLIVHGSNMDFT